MWRIASRLSQIKYRFIVLIAVPILFELVFVTVLVQLLEQSEREMHRQDRARSVVASANTLSRAYYNTGIMLGAYGVSPMNPLLRASYQRNLADIAPTLEQLHVLVSDNQDQLRLFDQLTRRSDEYVRQLKGAEQDKLYLHADESFPAAKARFEGFVSMLQAQMTHLNSDLKGLTLEEAGLENQSLQGKSRSRNAFKVAVALGVVLNIILAVVLAIVFNRTIQKGSKY